MEIHEMVQMFAEDARLHGTLGRHEKGETKSTVTLKCKREGIPDYHCQIDEILPVGDRVVSRMTYTGPSREVGGIEPTGARFEYIGAAFWWFSQGLIDEVWVVADTQGFWRAIGQL